jgi:hypothetical protein
MDTFEESGAVRNHEELNSADNNPDEPSRASPDLTSITPVGYVVVPRYSHARLLGTLHCQYWAAGLREYLFVLRTHMPLYDTTVLRERAPA